MKKLFIMSLIVQFICTSCSEVDYSKEIVGTWTFSKITHEVKTNNENLTKGIEEFIDKSYATYNGTVVFKSDGTYIKNESETYTYSIKGDKVTIIYSPEESITMKIKIENGNLAVYCDSTPEYDQNAIARFISREEAEGAKVEKVTYIEYFAKQ